MEKTIFKFPKKKIFLKPINRKGGWLPDNHDGAFMFTGTYAKYPVPISSITQKVVVNASEEELAALEKAMSMPEGFLNPNKPDKENFWMSGGGKSKKQPILRISKDGLELNLEDPNQYLLYIIAKSNKNVIAPSWDKRLDNAEYKFAIVDMDEQLVETASKVDLTKDGWMAYGSISNSLDKMRTALKLLTLDKGLKISKTATESFIKLELEKYLESDTKHFIDVVKDPDLNLKGVVLDAIDKKHITKDGLKYYITGNPDAKMTFENLIEYLKEAENQDILLKLKDQIAV